MNAINEAFRHYKLDFELIFDKTPTQDEIMLWVQCQKEEGLKAQVKKFEELNQK